ncbi:MAG TPA: T9SS type A sorting domain-containing protein [Candidatus Marinimicrobia bacterium]|nr:T9SS type A sorting domain-containing protein [Candidatus Neomarinimicrobiota bacterium]
MTIVRISKSIFIANLVAFLFAQAPEGYYDSAIGLEDEALRSELHQIIDEHQVQSYSSLWSHFQSTDKKPNGKVWDMYSDIPDGTPPYEYTFVSDQCGNYGSEGDCYNREHSWPSSWFNDDSPMRTDLFHLYPTDGYVNGMRSNYPYGEVSNPNWASLNGSKRGNNSTPGYSGTVFEPIDEYKGDFARTYFYMSTRYYTEDSGWENNGMVNGADLKDWAVTLLINWHNEDPVSEKETDRNNAVYIIQQNRNPFIDHPEWADCIWDENCDISVDEVGIPSKVTFHQNFPNPFNPTTTISFSVETHRPDKIGTSLLIYDIMGRLVATLIDEQLQPGEYEVLWNASELSSGIYLSRLESGNIRQTRKLLLLK